ncbi:glutathionylspermidine synthase family protein [Candidatus Gracilibacteria bacterium]|nr:glutathionylspermidine synthase family protein [Candidatus Gracilibacteria bacterium]
MKLSKFDSIYTEKYTPKYWLDFFVEKYHFEDFSENHFDYIDTKTFIEFSKEELELNNEIVRKVNEIFRKAYAFYFENFEKNLPEFSGFKDLFRVDFPYNEYFIARYDIMIDESRTLRFLETNANTPGMICESHYPARLLNPPGYSNQSEKLIEYTKSWWQKKKEELQLEKIAIFTAYTHENEDYFVCCTYANILEEVFGKENIIVGDIYDMNIIDDTHISIKGEKIDAILSYFPLEFFLTDIDFAGKFFNIIRGGGCFLANPIESMIPQDKLIFAVIWENIENYTEEEQVTIKKHIPFTSRSFQDDEKRFLAKWRFGRYGREIYTSRFYTNIDDDNRYIYQEKVIPWTVNDRGDYLVISAYSDFQECISWISRKQEFRTTDDTYNGVTLIYTSNT